MPSDSPASLSAEAASRDVAKDSAGHQDSEVDEFSEEAMRARWNASPAGLLSACGKSAVLVALLALYARVSQLNLAPVFGGVPSSLWHAQVLVAGCFAGWAGSQFLRSALLPRGGSPAQVMPLVAMYTPAVHFFVGRWSEALGPRWGPLVMEGLTLFPLTVLTTASVADVLEPVMLAMLPSGLTTDAVPAAASWGLLKLTEGYISSLLQVVIGRFFVLTRLGLELLLAASYAALAPSKYLVYAVPALMHTATLNTHVPTAMSTAVLTQNLLSDGWLMLERRESVTGYLSVLENVEKGFRVMRCDHSLLGGEWTKLGGDAVAEPIYGIFVMMEAVRLVEREQPVSDAEAKALVVGLGIGTTPSAFVSHGINTTVVEIDPAVHALATKYFRYQQNNPPVLEDAVGYTSKLAGEAPGTYDYIVHDVFTGGAEPVNLFTVEFLQGLSGLLKPDGVIAINYAGDLGLPAAQIIVRTISEVFPTCRAFRESPLNQEVVDAGEPDFANMVIFCTKAAAGRPLTFRRPEEKDYLQSRSRQAYLEPKHEVRQADIVKGGEDVAVLRRNNTAELTRWHKESAIGHWNVIRTVIPSKIWEMW